MNQTERFNERCSASGDFWVWTFTDRGGTSQFLGVSKSKDFNKAIVEELPAQDLIDGKFLQHLSRLKKLAGN